MSLSTHVLDTVSGRPAAGVVVRLESRDPYGAWQPAGEGHTGTDGRLRDWLPAGEPAAGRHRLVFEVAAHFAAGGVRAFFPEVSVEFDVAEAGEHLHVPLLISPFAYSTYRGS